ncbi:MAG: hypothetical protein ACHQ1D_00355 [Nitrososphaerales archaeon]
MKYLILICFFILGCQLPSFPPEKFQPGEIVKIRLLNEPGSVYKIYYSPGRQNTYDVRRSTLDRDGHSIFETFLETELEKIENE